MQHSEGAKFPCDECDEAFFYRGDLVRHKWTHSDIKVCYFIMQDNLYNFMDFYEHSVFYKLTFPHPIRGGGGGALFITTPENRQTRELQP